MTHMWRSEDNLQEGVRSLFLPCGSWDWTQVLRQGPLPTEPPCRPLNTGFWNECHLHLPKFLVVISRHHPLNSLQPHDNQVNAFTNNTLILPFQLFRSSLNLLILTCIYGLSGCCHAKRTSTSSSVQQAFYKYSDTLFSPSPTSLQTTMV